MNATLYPHCGTIMHRNTATRAGTDPVSMPAIPTIPTSLVTRANPPSLSSRASAASREISSLRASTAKIPRLAALARDDDGVVVH
ncbi:hypothetical protein, partial [Bifidobacterium aquikefiri]|uniref:hypothetical protein n=1 Tax=Bifidobacterium aquikefiri TaxID=1653207 RepID=UPI0039EAD887